jgi:flagellar protein FliL
MASAATTTAEIPEPAPEIAPVVRKPSSTPAFIATILILTGLSVGCGGLMGLQLLGKMEAGPPSKVEARSGQGSGQSSGQAAKSRYPAGANLRALPPILTNLASPARTWIRLEAALVVDGEQTPEANMLVAQVAEDIVAFLRTVTLVQIQGASGFQHLREDLNDRVRVRSAGKVRDLVIQSMIIE